MINAFINGSQIDLSPSVKVVANQTQPISIADTCQLNGSTFYGFNSSISDLPSMPNHDSTSRFMVISWSAMNFQGLNFIYQFALTDWADIYFRSTWKAKDDLKNQAWKKIQIG